MCPSTEMKNNRYKPVMEISLPFDRNWSRARHVAQFWPTRHRGSLLMVFRTAGSITSFLQTPLLHLLLFFGMLLYEAIWTCGSLWRPGMEISLTHQRGRMEKIRPSSDTWCYRWALETTLELPTFKLCDMRVIKCLNCLVLCWCNILLFKTKCCICIVQAR